MVFRIEKQVNEDASNSKPNSSENDMHLIFTGPMYEMRPFDDFETFRKTDEEGWNKIVELHYPSRKRDQQEGRERKERYAALRWPRNPQGEVLREDESGKGKTTPNGCELWGATLYDFYIVARMPSLVNLRTISTGSKLAAWCKQKGELDCAREELERAEMEEDPHQIHVFDIGRYLEVLEDQVSKGRVGKPMDIDRSNTKEGSRTLYAPSEYPAPWPLKPFSAPLARLQRKYPHSALPRKLIVHDPWNALLTTNGEARRVNPSECKWGTKEDNIRTYTLKLTSDSKKKKKEQDEGAQTGTENDESGEQENNEQKCSVAHLYISPKRRIGRGNHSFVYQAELELPREMLVRPKACWECSMSKYCLAKHLYQKGVLDDEYKEWILNSNVREVSEYFTQASKLGWQPTEEGYDNKFPTLKKYIVWQSKPPYCEHLDRGVLIPPSHRVSVTAKLCLPDDDVDDHEHQLIREAKLYQKFPSHMFEHWNGYNIIPPMHDPTPVGAVAPQFYGYYVPDEENEPLKSCKYMSPILLLEHCGVQVDPNKLSLDDRQECFSLIRRLHYAGFTHGSIYQRNFVVQYGPLQGSPFKRSKRHLRFRLIDFGRTRELEPHYDDRRPRLELSSEVRSAGVNLGLDAFGYY
ncbi:hypothetical protein ACEPAF_1451 [Sanghuangporus sanghuang]